MPQITPQLHEPAFRLIIWVELVTDIIGVSCAIDKPVRASRPHAEEAAAKELTCTLEARAPGVRDTLCQQRLTIVDDRLDALANLGRHAVAGECLSSALVLLPLKGLRLNAQFAQRLPQEQVARREAEHHQGAIGIRDYLACATGD